MTNKGKQLLVREHLLKGIELILIPLRITDNIEQTLGRKTKATSSRCK